MIEKNHVGSEKQDPDPKKIIPYRIHKTGYTVGTGSSFHYISNIGPVVTTLRNLCEQQKKLSLNF
jgi:hypothetical protein